jgi:asparagine N-glycosylation enzyme membrane subunit Stt3
MNSLVDSPFLLPVAVATAVLASLYVFSSRHRTLGFTETAFLISALSVALIGFGTAYVESYGWVLFVLWPFLIGAGSVVLYGRNAPPRRIGRYVGVASVSLVLIGAGLVLIAAKEGIFLFFAAPIACELMLLGIGIAYRLQERFRGKPRGARLPAAPEAALQGGNALKQCSGLPNIV